MKTYTIEELKLAASNLIEDGSNKEYTRGICELLADIDGIAEIPHCDRAMQIKKILTKD